MKWVKGVLLSITLMAPSHLWASPEPESQQHPLQDVVWNTSNNQPESSIQSLLDQLESGSWLLLGEQHDHPDHHLLQQHIIDLLAQQNRLGNVAMEMANTEQQDLLDEWLGRGDEVTADMLNWSQGWPWERYQLQVTTALNEAHRVLGADLTREAQMHAYRYGASEGQLDDAHTRYMMELIHTSHCEMLPRANLVQMLQVQLGRDQQMARTMAENTHPDKINILIAGAIHVRNDLGIPRWLAQPTTSLILKPLSEKLEASDYIDPTYPDFPLRELSSDFLLFTPTMPEQDYCDAFQ